MKEKDTERLWNANYTKVWVANFMIFFSFMLLTPLLPIYLSEQFAANKDTIGLVLFGYAVMALVARLFSGYIVDSFPRKTVLLLSFAVFTLFFVGYVAAGTLVLFAVVRTVHGMPFGFTTVANSTVAIDVLPSSRRTEGIGLYGLSNNLASAISPMVAIWIYTETHNFDIIFWMATAVAAIGLIIDGTVKTRPRERVKGKQKVSLDRFFLVKGTGAALTMVCFAFSYGVMSTYVAIYGKETLGIEGGSGTFFLLLSVGLILSRLQGNKALRERRITYNASIGVCVSLLGYLLCVAARIPAVCRSAQRDRLLRRSADNRPGQRPHVPGLSEHVCGFGSAHTARHSQQLDTGVVGRGRGTGHPAGRCADGELRLRDGLLDGMGGEPGRICRFLAICQRAFHPEQVTLIKLIIVYNTKQYA